MKNDSTQPLKKERGRKFRLLETIGVLIAALTLAYYLGWIKIPKIIIHVKQKISVDIVNRKIEIQPFESMFNNGTGTGFIESCDADVFPVKDEQASIHFEADGYLEGENVHPFIAIGVKEGETPIERYVRYRQTSLGEIALVAGEYCVKLHFHHRSKNPFVGEETETIVRYFTLDDADVERLNQKKTKQWKHYFTYLFIFAYAFEIYSLHNLDSNGPIIRSKLYD